MEGMTNAESDRASAGLTLGEILAAVVSVQVLIVAVALLAGVPGGF